VEGPLILVVEDEYPLQGLVEEAQTEGGFATDILKGRMNGWEVARLLREVDPEFP
jgi:DNA-binding response OmpR family regulator